MDPVTSDHAAALIDAFVLTGRRDRYRNLLKSPKLRAKLRAALAHCRDLDPRCKRSISPSDQDASGIAALLRSRAAPDSCYLLSESPQLDGRVLPLDEALAAVVGQGFGTLISCVPGQLGYYEGEERGERYILDRAAV